MIYTEQIGNDNFDVVLTRQGFDADGKWYATFLEYVDMDGNVIADIDNADYIFQKLLPMLNNKEWSAVGQELNVAWDKKAHKELREVLRKAVDLGWYEVD